MLQAEIAFFVKSVGWDGSAVPYIFKYQLVRVPLFWAEPKVARENIYYFIYYLFISRFVPIEYIQVLEQKDIASLQGSTTYPTP